MNKEELEKIKNQALLENIPIIMDDTLEVIEKTLKEKPPQKILEIGTAVGYSAMCFSEFLKEKGLIDTIERDEERVKQAIENIFWSFGAILIKVGRKCQLGWNRVSRTYVPSFMLRM